MEQSSIFCEFDQIDMDNYVCNKCGMRVYSEDGPPPMVCYAINASSDAPETELSVIDKIKNFAKATQSHILSGAKLCTDEQIEQRYEVCIKCPYFMDNTCDKCGCPLYRNKKFISKLSWADQACPIGRWGKEET